MGLFNQLIRGIKESIRNIRDSFSWGKKKRRKIRSNEAGILEIPSKWRSESVPGKHPRPGKDVVVIKHKKRIPGLLWFKRILAGFLLFFNFILSQVLLGSIGEGGQPMFILFLLNSFILLDYLWKTRRQKE